MASSLGTTHPCITSPFWYENLDGYGFQNVLDTFSTLSAKNLTSVLAFKFLNGEASKFLYDYGGSVRTTPKRTNFQPVEISRSSAVFT